MLQGLEGPFRPPHARVSATETLCFRQLVAGGAGYREVRPALSRDETHGRVYSTFRNLRNLLRDIEEYKFRLLKSHNLGYWRTCIDDHKFWILKSLKLDSSR